MLQVCQMAFRLCQMSVAARSYGCDCRVLVTTMTFEGPDLKYIVYTVISQPGVYASSAYHIIIVVYYN